MVARPFHLREKFRGCERFVRTVALLSHPNIVAIHDAGTTGDISHAVMELLEGETRGERLAQDSLPVRKIVDINTRDRAR